MSKGNTTSVLDVEVSCFASYQGKEPKPVNLLTWLRSSKYADEILTLRSIRDKRERDQIKATLPAITVSGLFYPQRKAEFLIQHSGLICIDIDYKDNEHIGNYNSLKELLFNIRNVAYVGLSASGRGYFLIIPIAYPAYHALHFNALAEDFSLLGITIDKAPKSVVSLRGYSYDPTALFRHSPVIYSNRISNSIIHNTNNKELLKRKKKGKGQSPSQYSHSNPKWQEMDKEDQVNAITTKLIAGRIDITANEPQWFRIACALANEFGEGGRSYYHAISQFHPKYSYQETDRKYNHALKGGYKKIGIGTFFKIAADHLRF